MPTIGVSLAVPEPWGRELQDYRVGLGDGAATHIPTHITLLPPLEVGEPDVTRLEEHLAEVAARTAAFRVHLRGTGSFRPVSPVVFVGVVDGISACEQLAADVRSGPVAPKQGFPYHPHVTVAHHLGDDLLDRAFTELDGFEAAFEATEMWMYRHDPLTGWQPARSFALSGA